MENKPHVPHFIRDFSKSNKEHQAERSETAAAAIEARRQQREKKQELSEAEKRVEALKETIADLSQNGVKRVANYFKLRALHQELGQGEEKIAQLEQERGDMKQARELVDGFYQEMQEKWHDAAYDAETIRKHFTEENLENLSLEDYGLLLSRFRREIATHVTRQGVRDHADRDHTEGLGDFHDGMQGILESKRFHSPLATQINKHGMEKVVYSQLASMLEDEQEIDGYGQTRREQALTWLEYLNRGKISDPAAIHFAYNEVLDGIYGGERENEAFLIYPMQLLASEYVHRPSDKYSDKFHNDIYVWTKEQEGLSVDAAVVFLPKTTPIDAETGSRYALDESRRPIVNQELVDTMVKGFENPDFAQKVQEASAEYESKGYVPSDIKFELSSLLAGSDEALQWEMQSELYRFIHKWSGDITADRFDPKQAAVALLSSVSRYYVRSQETIPAQDYWENYFAQHPEARPSKVVYYSGTPTKGMDDWLDSHNVRPDYDKSVPSVNEFTAHNQAYYQPSPEYYSYGLQEYFDLGRKIIDRFAPASEEKQT